MTRWLIASGDFTTLGGMDRANHALAAYLARTGRDVHLVAHRVSDDLAREPRVHVHGVGRPFGAHLIGAPLLARSAARQSRALGAGARVLINGGNAPVAAPTWIHYLHAAYEPIAPGSLRTRIALAAGRGYYLRAEAAAVHRAPLIICNSRRTADDVGRAYAGAGSRTRVVYYGVAPGAFGPISDEERARARRAIGLPTEGLAAVFIGALGDRRKGFDIVYDAWRGLGTEWDVDLIVAGAGGEREAWIARAASDGLARRIRFLGFRPDIQQVIAAADVLVHPARYEAYGLGVHEALCRGLPAIVTAVCGIAERYPAPLAELVVADPPEAAHVITALAAWRADVDAWRDRAAACGAALRSRTWDDMAADVMAAVESL
ncbi:MAG: glycosyltransferase family 4 protein [Vicinamibacterales bacterium]